jgi:hypothetical protein
MQRFVLMFFCLNTLALVKYYLLAIFYISHHSLFLSIQDDDDDEEEKEVPFVRKRKQPSTSISHKGEGEPSSNEDKAEEAKKKKKKQEPKAQETPKKDQGEKDERRKKKKNEETRPVVTVKENPFRSLKCTRHSRFTPPVIVVRSLNPRKPLLKRRKHWSKRTKILMLKKTRFMGLRKIHCHSQSHWSKTIMPEMRGSKMPPILRKKMTTLPIMRLKIQR